MPDRDIAQLFYPNLPGFYRWLNIDNAQIPLSHWNTNTHMLKLPMLAGAAEWLLKKWLGKPLWIGHPVTVALDPFLISEPLPQKNLFQLDPSKNAVIISTSNQPSPPNGLWKDIPADPAMVLAIRPHWKHLEDYLTDLTAKYRTRYRKVLHETQDLNVVRFQQNQYSSWQMRQWGLLWKKAMYHKSWYLIEKRTAFFEALNHLPGKLHTFECTNKDGVLLGFASCYLLPEARELVGIQLCINPEGARKKVYERLLLEMLSLGIEKQARNLHLGRTAVEIKSSFGAKPQPSYFHVLIRHRFLEKLVESLKQRYVSPPYIYRNPFKYE